MATKIQYINGFYTGNAYLNQTQGDVNAVWVYSYLTAISNTPWTSLESICAMLGNAWRESHVNPGMWQGLSAGYGPAYGLLQWDPFSKYINWCKEQNIEPAYMDSALKRIQYEMHNNIQWIPLRLYNNQSFEEFARNEYRYSLETLVRCFMRCYERPGVEQLDERVTAAQRYYTLLSGSYPPPPVPIDPDTPT
ncbi:MAG: hypothetical protein K2H85_04435, partial [Allobaculum sp.]|nr:hypothetical protein [Allobaculum sp.]